MRMNKSRSIVGVAVGVSSLVLVAAGFISYRAVDQLARTSDEVLRAKELELSLERLLSTLRDAETGQRGFLLSGSEEYLAPYSAALREVEGRVVTVEARLQARDGRADEMRTLRPLLDRKLAELARTITLFRAGEREAALALVRSDEGRIAMDAIRAFVGRRALVERRNVDRLIEREHAALDTTVRASEERLATTLRSIGDAVIATDEKGHITMTNPVAESLTGWSFAEARGRPLDDVFRIVNENTRETVESPVAKLLREGGIVGLANHTVLIRKTGGETAIEDSGAPISDSAGVMTGVVLVFRDATRERAAQNALRTADRRKDEFLATLSHELRNPLAPIRQAAGLAAHADAKPEQIRWGLAVIERQAAHMARLLDDLLDVSRITRGRLEVRRTRVALRGIVESAVETAQPTIDAGKHRLRVELPAEPLFLDADALRIAQVVGNLLTNAAKYTPPGGDIRLAAARDGDQLVLRVADNGIGLAARDLPHIFEMFAQVKPTLDRKEAGLGIGLALSKALVELHGGTLEARSAGPGQGSEFIARLALAPSDAAADTAAASASMPDAGVRRLRVLLADDNRDACDSLEMLLTIEGSEVRTAYDGESALALMAQFRPDIALLDIGMPHMNGYELAAEVRKQPWGADIHLVAVTGWGQADDRRRSLEAGFDTHLVKPVDFADVRAVCDALGAARRA